MPRKPRPCKNGCVLCGARNVHWVKTRWGWRLIEGDHVHKCEDYSKELSKVLFKKN